MYRISLLLAVFLFFFNLSIGQEKKTIQGKIVSENGNVSGVLVLNLNTERETKSDIEGNFSIEVQPDDLLVFQSDNLEYLRKIIDPNDFSKTNIVVKMIAKVNQLDEIKIFNYSNINAVSLGILSKPAIAYTVGERRLVEARSGIGIGALINALSGRTKMLKRYAAFEKVDMRAARLKNMFEPRFFTKQLTIDESLIGRFVGYAAEQKEVAKAMSTNNKFLISFELVKIAENFKKLQREN